MTVAELQKKLSEYPEDNEVVMKTFGDDKIIVIVVGHELDPICQCRLSLLGLTKNG